MKYFLRCNKGHLFYYYSTVIEYNDVANEKDKLKKLENENIKLKKQIENLKNNDNKNITNIEHSAPVLDKTNNLNLNDIQVVEAQLVE